jgi:hypothetical protein
MGEWPSRVARRGPSHSIPFWSSALESPVRAPAGGAEGSPGLDHPPLCHHCRNVPLGTHLEASTLGAGENSYLASKRSVPSGDVA